MNTSGLKSTLELCIYVYHRYHRHMIFFLSFAQPSSHLVYTQSTCLPVSTYPQCFVQRVVIIFTFLLYSILFPADKPKCHAYSSISSLM